eukprot:scaffold113151_cov23-Tisochrysis_lutea.AAC.1
MLCNRVLLSSTEHRARVWVNNFACLSAQCADFRDCVYFSLCRLPTDPVPYLMLCVEPAAGTKPATHHAPLAAKCAAPNVGTALNGAAGENGAITSGHAAGGAAAAVVDHAAYSTGHSTHAALPLQQPGALLEQWPYTGTAGAPPSQPAIANQAATHPFPPASQTTATGAIAGQAAANAVGPAAAAPLPPPPPPPPQSAAAAHAEHIANALSTASWKVRGSEEVMRACHNLAHSSKAARPMPAFPGMGMGGAPATSSQEMVHTHGPGTEHASMHGESRGHNGALPGSQQRL